MEYLKINPSGHIHYEYIAKKAPLKANAYYPMLPFFSFQDSSNNKAA